MFPVCRLSSISKGQAFEHAVLLYLSFLGFFIRSTGGVGDGGIDFRGTWKPSKAIEPVPVVGQCKALSGKVGVHVIREMEGILCREEPGTFGVVVSEKGFSLISRKGCKSSKFPLLLVGFDPSLGGKLSEFWYNDLVQQLVPNLRIGFSFIKRGTSVTRVVHLIDPKF
jgi:hypothetical protein